MAVERIVPLAGAGRRDPPEQPLLAVARNREIGSPGTWRLILDAALDAVIVMDTSGSVVDWNAGAEAMFGWTKAEAVGRNMAELIIPPQLREAHAQGLRRYLDTALERVIGRRLEVTGLRKSGGEFPVELSISAISDANRLLFIGFLRDLSSRKEAEDELRASEERFSKAFNASAHPMSISTLKERRLVDLNAAGLAAIGKRREELIGRTVEELGFYGDPAEAQKVRDVLRKDGHFDNLELTFKNKRGRRVYLVSGAQVELRGEACALISAVDITDRKQDEDKVRLVMREMNHRANNLLALVLGLVQQTGRALGDERVTDRIVDRIKGLTASNQLLVSGDWRGADLQELIQSQLSPFVDVAARVSLAGPPVHLSASATQAVGMALHELATNAVKYGALSAPDGAIRLEWSLARNEKGSVFQLTWTEQGGPPVDPPQRSGFGRVVIEQMIRHSLSGETDLQFSRSGISWTLRCPAKEILER
jgi:PAS domain S-box-containing protein